LREDSEKNRRDRAVLDLPEKNDYDRLEGLNICIDSCDDLFILSCDELSVEASETTCSSLNSPKNAIDVAVDLFDENDNIRCKILKICIRYANAAKLGSSISPSNYPILLTAVGLVPPVKYIIMK